MSARAIVLAAGKGTRMKSARPKVLHELCGRPMLWWVLEALRAAGVDDVVVVTNPELDPLLAAFGVRTVIQREQLGTGHAVRIALDALEPRDGTLVVAYGDMPLVDAAIFEDVQAAVDADAGTALALVTARMPLPSSFGRIVRAASSAESTPGSTADADSTTRSTRTNSTMHATANAVERIVEAKDCTPEQLAIDEMNAGIYAYDEAALRETIVRVTDDNAQREYYLTDTVELLIASGRRVAPVTAPDYRSVLGVNDRVELSTARTVVNRALCALHMRNGVTIVDPATTYLDAGVSIGADTIVYPGTTIGGATTIGASCRIGPHARIAGATIADGVQITESVVLDSTVGPDCTIGPFAHLRGHSVLDGAIRIGNFVETKNAHLERGVKANHLAYLGDAEIGEDSNIGAGTITANYDGVRKHRTTIGKKVKIGSNNTLVAPVSVGDGAMTGAGTVVIRPVDANDKVVGNPARSIAKKPVT